MIKIMNKLFMSVTDKPFCIQVVHTSSACSCIFFSELLSKSNFREHVLHYFCFMEWIMVSKCNVIISS